MMTLVISLLLLVLPYNQPPQTNRTASLPAILNDNSLWGKDFSAALPSLPAWQQVGEPQVTVFSDRIIGSRTYERPEAAQSGATELRRALATPRPALPGATAARNFRAETLTLLEDDSVHVALINSSLQLLNPELTRAVLERRLGPPEKVSSLTLQNKLERRPIVLTLYQYAGGAVVFAEPNLSQRPGFVDRVFLDVPALTNAVFPEEKTK